jgi:hypothetical protein
VLGCGGKVTAGERSSASGGRWQADGSGGVESGGSTGDASTGGSTEDALTGGSATGGHGAGDGGESGGSTEAGTDAPAGDAEPDVECPADLRFNTPCGEQVYRCISSGLPLHGFTEPGCTDHVVCDNGFWTTHRVCPSDARCPADRPVTGAPCGDEGLVCSYQENFEDWCFWCDDQCSLCDGGCPTNDPLFYGQGACWDGYCCWDGAGCGGSWYCGDGYWQERYRWGCTT